MTNWSITSTSHHFGNKQRTASHPRLFLSLLFCAHTEFYHRSLGVRGEAGVAAATPALPARVSGKETPYDPDNPDHDGAAQDREQNGIAEIH